MTIAFKLNRTKKKVNHKFEIAFNFTKEIHLKCFLFFGGYSIPFGDSSILSPEGSCESRTEGGPIVFTYVLFLGRKRILDFKFTYGNLPFWDLENILFGADGWGGVGRSIKRVLYFFFILRYIKHCTHVNLYTNKKCPGKFLVGLKIWTSWGPEK